MKTSKQYRNQAWDALQNNWGSAAGTTLLILFLSVVCFVPSYLAQRMASPEIVSITAIISIVLMFLLVSPLTLSFWNTLLDMVRTSTTPSLGSTFNNFKNNWGKLTAYYVILNLLIIAISALFVGLMFIIPTESNSIVGILSRIVTMLITLGYIVSVVIIPLMYSMTPFIFHDNPNIGVKEALRASRIMMKGHKEDLLLLYITFIGWIWLGIITLGIALLWVMPYVYTAQAAFYEDIREPQVEGAI